MLEVENLAVSYRGIYAVERVSFAIAPGQLVGLIGPNGAGKSTVVKAMLGLIAASSGVVRFRSRPLRQQLQQVAYVPQRSQIDWDYPITVQNVVMMARTRHTGWFCSPSRQSQAIVQEALERVGMWEWRKCQIGELSGGQQQRVFLARALAQQAELFCFDEPFVGIDKKTEEIIFTVFAELKSQEKTLLVVTHDLGQTLNRYDRFLLLNKQLIADGSHSQVITSSNIKKAYGDSVFLIKREDS